MYIEKKNLIFPFSNYEKKLLRASINRGTFFYSPFPWKVCKNSTLEISILVARSRSIRIEKKCGIILEIVSQICTDFPIHLLLPRDADRYCQNFSNESLERKDTEPTTFTHTILALFLLTVCWSPMQQLERLITIPIETINWKVQARYFGLEIGPLAIGHRQETLFHY